MLRLVRDAKVPTIGICMGEIGTPTRVLTGKFGAPFTYATFHHERKLAPGQLSFKQMREMYRYDQINADTEVYGVIADPVAHNLSPVVHNAGFGQLNLNKVYLPFRVPPDDLPSFMESCRELGIKGLGVSLPHKEEVLRFLHQADGAVRGIGTANTIVFEEEQLVGYNTDYRAFVDCLDQVMPAMERVQNLVGKTGLVLGSGGVARAIAYAFKRREADVVIASRTYDNAKRLAERLRCRCVQWYERTKVEPDIIVNGTPIGMHPNVDETPFDAAYLNRGMVVVDTVFDPEQTLLVKQAREKNCRVVTGVDMFVRQAAAQFAHFTGQEAPLEVMRTALKRATGPAQL